jgi:hypothetical protein
MAVMMFVVWGVALMLLLGLGAALILTLRQGERPAEDSGSAEHPLVSTTDTLLLYYEEESVRRTPTGDVVLRIPGIAWEREWQEDLVRLEVARLAASTVDVPADWGEAEVLAVYDLRAHRMTEIGTDIAVEQFAAPVDVFLIADGRVDGLRLGVQRGGVWTLALPAALSPEALEQAGIPAGQSWAAASITQLRPVCLVRSSSGGDA